MSPPSMLKLLAAALFQLASAAVVDFDLDLTWAKGAPDGQTREMIYMNGQFPGPALRIKQYDQVKFKIHNHLPYNVTVHFHGIEMLNTPWSDGVPGLTQKPVLPGESFTYKWTATEYGTYWYHAHARSLLADGLYGAIWIEPDPNTPQPFELISQNLDDIEEMRNAELDPNLVVLSDWTKFTSEEYQTAMEVSGLDIFCVDSILINGRGSVYCPGLDTLNDLQTDYIKAAIDNQPLTDKGCYPNIYKTQGDFPHDESKLPDGLNSGCYAANGSTEVIEVDPSKGWVSMKFICATALKTIIVSIDEHPMWIYEVDGHYIEPQLAHTVVMYNGQRYSAMIKLDKAHKDYTIRVPDTNADQIISGFATMRYKGSSNLDESTPYVNYGGLNTTADVITLDDRVLVPYPNIQIPRTADKLVNLTMGRRNKSYEWTLEGKELYDVMANYEHPILFNLSAKANLASKVVIENQNGTWVDILFQVGLMPDTPPIQAAHVMHKHSNKFFVIGQGEGFFNWTSVDEAAEASPELFELERPQYRDTVLILSLLGPGWVVVRYQVVNPGPFLVHCHIETHLFNGMAVALLDGVDKWPEVPPEYAE